MSRRAAALGATCALLVLGHGVAAAGWGDASSASAGYSSAILAAPTAPLAAPGVCTLLVGDQVQVSWTASASGWAGGYEVARSTTSGGPYTVVGTVTAPVVAFTDGPLAFSTTYHYVVRATKHTWRSANSAQVSRTTRNVACL